MSTRWRVLRSLAAHPRVIAAGPRLDLFLLRYMRKFRVRAVGNDLILRSHLPPLKSGVSGHPGGMVPLAAGDAATLHPPRLPQNVWVADASLFPESPGGPPSPTVMALAKRVARTITEAC